jgi:hypothetical protein
LSSREKEKEKKTCVDIYSIAIKETKISDTIVSTRFLLFFIASK